jgi:hypothetical protein
VQASSGTGTLQLGSHVRSPAVLLLVVLLGLRPPLGVLLLLVLLLAAGSLVVLLLRTLLDCWSSCWCCCCLQLLDDATKGPCLLRELQVDFLSQGSCEDRHILLRAVKPCRHLHMPQGRCRCGARVAVSLRPGRRLPLLLL